MNDPEIPNQGMGKIARYPKAERDRICALLRDGARYQDIIATCRKMVEDGLTRAGSNEPVEIPTEVNLTNFKNGRLYKQWLRQQERLDGDRIRRELAMEIVKNNEGSTVSEAALSIAASHIYDVLDDFDVSVLKDRLALKPEELPKLIAALGKVAGGGTLDFDKFKEQVRRAQEAILKVTKQAGERGGLTDDDLAEIERAAKLMT